MSYKKQSGIKILVVDDEVGMRDLLSYELASHGYNVITAEDGIAALEVLNRETVHLVITDVMMPRLDGMMLLERIKVNYPALEVIVCTGYGSLEAALAAIKNGAFDYVLKPFNMEEIIHLVRKALERSELKTLIAIYETSQIIFKKQGLDSLISRVLGFLQKAIPSDEGCLFLVSTDQKIELASSFGLTQESEELHRGVAAILHKKNADNVKEFLLQDKFDEFPEFAVLNQQGMIQSVIVCPMVIEGEWLGSLNLVRRAGSDRYSPVDLRNAAIFVAQVGLAVRNGQLDRILENKMEELGKAYMSLEGTKNDLVQSEKLASIGRLVAGVAHEINNPLTAVIGYSQLLISNGELAPEAKNQMQVVFREAQRCKKIIQDLLIFARRRKSMLLPNSPKAVIDELMILEKESLQRNKILWKIEVSDLLPNIYCDKEQILMVLQNIMQNASMAMEHQKEERVIKVSANKSKSSDEVLIEIEDTGPGIPREYRARIFDPFFTTREVGQGTGLGLSIAYGILQEHGGVISLEEKNGRGALFVLKLRTQPLIPSEVSLKPKDDISVYPSIRSRDLSGSDRQVSKHILLVEDDQVVQSFMKTILESKGFEVTCAHDGVDGFEHIKSVNYDLIITDYLLPKMNGKKLYSSAVDLTPELKDKFLVVTGSMRIQDSSDMFFKGCGVPVLSKPFTGQELLSMVSKKLNIQN